MTKWMNGSTDKFYNSVEECNKVRIYFLKLFYTLFSLHYSICKNQIYIYKLFNVLWNIAEKIQTSSEVQNFKVFQNNIQYLTTKQENAKKKPQKHDLLN